MPTRRAKGFQTVLGPVTLERAAEALGQDVAEDGRRVVIAAAPRAP